MAHLLEEFRRFRLADHAGMDAAAGGHCGRYRLAAAEKDPDRQPGQLWLRRHGPAAGAADDHARLQAAADRQYAGRQAQGVLAGVPPGVHPRRGRVCDPDPAQGLHRDQRRGLRCGLQGAAPARHGQRRRGAAGQPDTDRRQAAALQRAGPAGGTARQDAGRLPGNARSDRDRRHAPTGLERRGVDRQHSPGGPAPEQPVA